MYIYHLESTPQSVAFMNLVCMQAILLLIIIISSSCILSIVSITSITGIIIMLVRIIIIDIIDIIIAKKASWLFLGCTTCLGLLV